MPNHDPSLDLQAPYRDLLDDGKLPPVEVSELGVGAICDPEFARALSKHTAGDTIEIRELVSMAYLHMPFPGQC